MTTPHDDQRDPRLAALLRATVDAPPLRPGFHDELEARLQAADTVGPTATGIPATCKRRLTARRAIAAAAVVAVAAVFAFAILPAIRGGGTATAADMLAAMTRASGGVQTVRLGIVTETSGDIPSRVDPATGKTYPRTQDRQVETVRLTMSIGGDSLTELTRTITQKTGDGPWTSLPALSHQTISYDERRRELRSGWSSGGGKPGFSVRRPAWPGSWSQGQSVPGDYASLAASLRAELAATDPDTPVHETTYLGRPAWRATFTEDQRWGMDQEIPVRVRWDVTVDQSTGLLMTVANSMRIKGEPGPIAFAMRVEKLELDPHLAPGWQRAPLPSEGRIQLVDEGIRFGTPDEVAKLSWPTLPLVPQWAPPGYRLTDAASASFGGVGGDPWTPAGDGRVVGRSGRFILRRAVATPGGQTALVRFRRGFGTFVVEITPKTFGGGLSSYTAGDGRPGAKDVTLTGGALKGVQARTWISPYKGLGPTLVTFSDRSQIVIWGDLTRQELIEVANSLKVYGDVNRPLPWGGGQ
jgi:hypothetical protein